MEKKMKKIIMTALALIIVAASTEAMAQPKAVLGLGGGVITSGSVPGGGINLTMNRAESPWPSVLRVSTIPSPAPPMSPLVW